MTVIFPECAGVELCSQCNSAFRVKDLRYYGKYKHNSSFRQGQTESPSPTHSSYVSRYVNQYPDLQFLSFGHLCINCRAPYVGEGNFEESSLDKQGLSAQGANAGLWKGKEQAKSFGWWWEHEQHPIVAVIGTQAMCFVVYMRQLTPPTIIGARIHVWRLARRSRGSFFDLSFW